MSPYTLVQAYFAMNLGDDMFVQTLVRRYPHERFFIMQPRKTLGDLAYEKNIRSLHLPMRLIYKIVRMFMGKQDSIYKYVCKRAKAVVKIGGSIFIEKQNWKENVQNIYNANTYIIGSNFGPYSTEEYLSYAVQQLNLVKDCCWRDRYSYDLFSDKVTNARYAPDILFSYSYLPIEEEGDSIGVSVIDFTQREDLQSERENYINGIAKICQYYIENKRDVILFGFCKKEKDEHAIDEIINILGPSSRIKKCIYSGNINEYLQAINKCKKIYATRFHAMIIGWIMKKDVVPIIYSNKQVNVINDIGFNGSQWDILHHQEFPLNAITADNGKLSDDAICALREKSCGHFSRLDELYVE